MTEERTEYNVPVDLEAIEAMLAAATQSPWGRGTFERDCIATKGGNGWVILRNGARCTLCPGDFDLIANAPAALIALIAEVRRLQSLLETEQHARWRAEHDAQQLRLQRETFIAENERLRLQVEQLAEALEEITGAASELAPGVGEA